MAPGLRPSVQWSGWMFHFAIDKIIIDGCRDANGRFRVSPHCLFAFDSVVPYEPVLGSVFEFFLLVRSSSNYPFHQDKA